MKHHFFYGVDWTTIRQIDAPFVPHLKSMTDTSYFPTDEIDQAPEEAPQAGGNSGKDLAFLGCVSLGWKSGFDIDSWSFQLYFQKIFDVFSHLKSCIGQFLSYYKCIIYLANPLFSWFWCSVKFTTFQIWFSLSNVLCCLLSPMEV